MRVGGAAVAGEPGADGAALPDSLDIVVDDAEGDPESAKPAIKARRSGLFRRLFGRKD